MNFLQVPFVCVETHRCRNVFGDESDHGERNSGLRSRDDKFSRQAGFSLETVAEWHRNLEKNLKNWLEDFHSAVVTCSGDQKGGGGQVQNTPTSPQNTVTTSGTQSTGTSNSNTAGGVGGSDPPEDGRGNPPISGHYSDHHGEDQGEDKSDNEDGFENTPSNSPEVSDDETAESNEYGERTKMTGPTSEVINTIPGIDAGVTCSWCKCRPKNIQLYFTAEVSGDVRTAIGVYCSQLCAENGKRGSQLVMSVNLWDTDSSSLRMCLVCDELKWMPLTVCMECLAFMCGNCGQASKDVNGSIRCPLQCPKNSDIIIVLLPACIAGPAQLRTIDLSSQVRDRQFNEELIQELRQHGRQQLEDENRRLDEMNELQDLFSTEEDQRSRPLVESLLSYIADESDVHGTALEPPTEDPSPVESGAQQEIDDPVAEEDVSELESHHPQEAPTILPAPKESEVEDGDEGVEVNFSE